MASKLCDGITQYAMYNIWNQLPMLWYNFMEMPLNIFYGSNRIHNFTSEVNNFPVYMTLMTDITTNG